MKATAAFLLVLCHLAISHAWNCREGPRLSHAWQIDAGQGQVVASDRYYHGWFLSGSRWYRLGIHGISHVSVGQAGIWAVGFSQRVYKYMSGNWALISGASLTEVDAGRPFPQGTDRNNNAYCLNTAYALNFSDVNSHNWEQTSTTMKYTSCGPYGCWGVGTNSLPYFSRTTTCRKVIWSVISGLSLNTIEVGADGSVVAVTTTGQIYQRTGISSHIPHGTHWVNVPICQNVRSASYDLNRIWAVSTSGAVMYCTR